MPVRSEFFPLAGGLNLVDPAVAIKPGQLLVGINYLQDMRGGYRRMPGYERYDGKNSPSAATYFRISFDAGANEPSTGSCSSSYSRPGPCMINGGTWTNGDTIKGATSGATGILLKVTVSSGSWAGNDAAGEFVLTEVSGTFQDNENLTNVAGSTTYAVAASAASEGASADTDFDEMSQDAIEVTRNLIEKVPGTGSVLGVWVYRNVVYAIRNKDFTTADTDEFGNNYGTNHTRAMLYKATSSGWTEMHLGYKLYYGTGSNAPEHNDYLMGYSGGTATGAAGFLSAYEIDSGSFSSNNATGDLYFYESDFGATNWAVGNTIVKRSVVSIAVNTAGSGYTYADVTISDPVIGITATATATISGGASGNVSAITVVTGGSGYVSTPTVTITGDGTGATATATVSNVTVGVVIAQPAAEGSVAFPQRLYADGQYEFLNHNFVGSEESASMFAANPNNHAFSIDYLGRYRPILTGMATDKPTHIAQHKNHLFLSFPNGSLQHSSIGDPYSWDAVTGAAEIVVGFDITGMQVLQGDVLAVFSKVKTWMLYGTSSADWNFKQFAAESGAKEYSVVPLGDDLYFMNDLGVTSLMATQSYGDYMSASHSQLVQPFLESRKDKVVATIPLKESNHLMFLFNDATALIASFDGRTLVGWTQAIYKHTPSTAINGCGACSSVDGDYVIGGATDGMVYRLGYGNSFDGYPIESFVRLSFNHFKSPGYKKRFRKLKIDLDSDDEITLNYQADLNYANAYQPTPVPFETGVRSGGAFWDTQNWNEFNWSVDAVGTAEAYINGTGNNMSLLIYHSTAYDAPHTLQGVTINYSMRGLDR